MKTDDKLTLQHLPLSIVVPFSRIGQAVGEGLDVLGRGH